MEDLSSEWRVVGQAETRSSSGCPFLRAQSYLTSSSCTASPALAPCPTPQGPSTKGGERSSRCPFMRLLFLVMSMLPSASAFSTASALPTLPKGAPTTLAPTTLRPTTRLSPSRPWTAARVPSVCGRDCGRHAAAMMRHDDRLTAQPEGLGLGPDSPDGGGGGGGKVEGKVLILGAGWMGSRVAAALGELGEEVEVTHRPRTDIDAKGPYFRPLELPASVPRHAFDLLAPESWDNLPPPEELSSVVVTFPLELPAAARFWHAYLHKVPTVLCYSSTSVYQVDVPGQSVDEHTPLRASPRAEAEAYLQHRGAQVLTLSGIFSEAAEARSICACLHGYLSSARAPHALSKTINLVHDGDIVQATVACLRRPHHGARFNVAGTHLALRDLLGHCAAQGVRVHEEGREEELFVQGRSDTSSKTVLSERLVEEVMPRGFAFRPIVSPEPQIEIAAEIEGEIEGEIEDEIEIVPEIETRREARAALLSDVLPLSPADWLSEANSLAA